MKNFQAKPRRRRNAKPLPRLSQILVDLRLEGGLTQRKVAKAIGVSVITLSRLERGDMRITVRNLEKILNFFDMELSAIPIETTCSAAPTADNLPQW